MPKDKFAQWLSLNKATQAVIDTLMFSETIIPTSPQEGKVIAVHAIDMLCGDTRPVADSWTSVHIATRPDLLLADLMPGSPYLVAWSENTVEAVGASGMAIGKTMDLQTFPKPFLIAHQKLYLYAASNNSGAAQTVRARILFTFEKVTTEEFFQALAAFGG